MGQSIHSLGIDGRNPDTVDMGSKSDNRTMETITTSFLKPIGLPDAYDIPSSLLEILGQQSISYLIHGNPKANGGHAFRPYNTRIAVSPLLIAYPTTIPQIQAIVRCVAALGLKISVRGGCCGRSASMVGCELEHVGEDGEDE